MQGKGGGASGWKSALGAVGVERKKARKRDLASFPPISLQEPVRLTCVLLESSGCLGRASTCAMHVNTLAHT